MRYVEAIVSKINIFNDSVIYLFYIDTPHANTFCIEVNLNSQL